MAQHEQGNSFYPDHNAYGKWDVIFEEEIFPKITGIFELLRLRSLNSYWDEKVGQRINTNNNVDWLQLETYCCKASIFNCRYIHKTFTEVRNCKYCGWTESWRLGCYRRGMRYFMKTYGGSRKYSGYMSWVAGFFMLGWPYPFNLELLERTS